MAQFGDQIATRWVSVATMPIDELKLVSKRVRRADQKFCEPIHFSLETLDIFAFGVHFKLSL